MRSHRPGKLRWPLPPQQPLMRMLKKLKKSRIHRSKARVETRTVGSKETGQPMARPAVLERIISCPLQRPPSVPWEPRTLAA